MKRLTRKASATAVLPSGAMIKDILTESSMKSASSQLKSIESRAFRGARTWRWTHGHSYESSGTAPARF